MPKFILALATALKVVADVGCHIRVVSRYDYVPYNGKSQLTIHKQGNTYIMRHGP